MGFIEAVGDIWDNTDLDAVCITTNGFVKNNGNLVMGRGIAREAARFFPDLPYKAGLAVKRNGNRVQIIEEFFPLVAFPVKHNWWEMADLDLIYKSALELVELTTKEGWNIVGLPRPGCGNGKRDWETEVKPLLHKLDERFMVYSLG